MEDEIEYPKNDILGDKFADGFDEDEPEEDEEESDIESTDL